MLDLSRRLAKNAPFKFVPWKEAQSCWASFRAEQTNGAKTTATKLLTPPNANTKLAKGLKRGIHEFGLSLAPAGLSVKYNACRFFSKECAKGCVAYAGHGEMPWVIQARIIKTLFLGDYPNEFFTLLMHELDADVWQKYGLDARVRPNNFSDLPWEVLCDMMRTFDRLRFYDYTKNGQRAIDANLGAFEWPGNYRLTLSASEKTSDSAIVKAVEEGVNYAVLFDVKPGRDLPSVWEGVQVIDGDLHDDRWLDPKYVIVGLRAKGRMRKGNWNMVRSPEGSRQ